MTIQLIIISRYNNTEYINNINSYFSSGYNSVTVNPTETNYETTLVSANLDISKYNLIIYDWSFSQNTSPSTIVNDLISAAGFDLIYLGKFLDTCSKYSVQSNVGSAPSMNIVSGTDPIGFNAILISPDFAGRLQSFINANANKYYSLSYALNDLAISETYIRYAISPNLFVYNPLYNSIDESQAYSVKTTECEPLNSQINPPDDSNLMIFWIIIIIIITCLIILFIVNFTPLGKRKKEKLTLDSII